MSLKTFYTIINGSMRPVIYETFDSPSIRSFAFVKTKPVTFGENIARRLKHSDLERIMNSMGLEYSGDHFLSEYGTQWGFNDHSIMQNLDTGKVKKEERPHIWMGVTPDAFSARIEVIAYPQEYPYIPPYSYTRKLLDKFVRFVEDPDSYAYDFRFRVSFFPKLDYLIISRE